MRIFGYEFFKKDAEQLPTFSIQADPTAENLESEIGSGGVVGYSLTNSTNFQTEQEYIKTYRQMSLSAEIGMVLNELRNEVFIFEGLQNRAIDIRFYDDSDLSEDIKTKIAEEFINIYNLLDFKNKGSELLESWYIDSKLFLHKIIDIKNKKAGIKKIIQIDPLKIKKIKEYPKPDKDGIYDLNEIREYYLFSESYDVFASNKSGSYSSSNTNQIGGIRIGPEYITYCDSGLYDRTQNIVLGYLYKTITPYNNLKLMEESLLIYRVARSPERRVFYIDVGNLPKAKAEQHLKEMMNRFRNKLTYDSKTGTLLDRTNALSMVEDYWLPRRSTGAAGTEITTLPSGDNTGITADVQYFKEKFLRSLNIPVSRFQDESTSLNYGATNTEISRDEYRFKKFIDNIRQKFSFIFEDLLRTQLLLKNIITEDDWEDIKSALIFVYEEDNNFVEAKELEILNKRLVALDALTDHVGKYFSEKWVMKNILKFSEETIKQMKLEISGVGEEKTEEPAAETPTDEFGTELPDTVDLSPTGSSELSSELSSEEPVEPSSESGESTTKQVSSLDPTKKVESL